MKYIYVCLLIIGFCFYGISQVPPNQQINANADRPANPQAQRPANSNIQRPTIPNNPFTSNNSQVSVGMSNGINSNMQNPCNSEFIARNSKTNLSVGSIQGAVKSNSAFVTH